MDGSTLTLCELVPLLTDLSFRRFVVNQPGLPNIVRAYWQRFDAMSDGERQQSTAPLLHKAEAFTSRTPIRSINARTVQRVRLRGYLPAPQSGTDLTCQGAAREPRRLTCSARLTSVVTLESHTRAGTGTPGQTATRFAYIDEAQICASALADRRTCLAGARV